MNATFTKLRDGSWGLRVNGSATLGDVVTVTKRSGERVQATVGRIVWSKGGVTLCEAGKAERRQPPQPRRPDVRIEFPISGATYCREEHGVYVYDEFPRGSVLEGQQRRAFKASGSLEECQAYCQEKFGFVPELVSGCGYVKPYVGHLSASQDW